MDFLVHWMCKKFEPFIFNQWVSFFSIVIILSRHAISLINIQRDNDWSESFYWFINLSFQFFVGWLLGRKFNSLIGVESNKNVNAIVMNATLCLITAALYGSLFPVRWLILYGNCLSGRLSNIWSLLFYENWKEISSLPLFPSSCFWVLFGWISMLSTTKSSIYIFCFWAE